MAGTLLRCPGPAGLMAALLPVAGTSGMLVLVWAATAGPIRLFGPAGTSAPAPSVGATASPSPTVPPSYAVSNRELTRHVRTATDLTWLGELVGYTVLLAAALGCWLLLRSLWRNARREGWLARLRPHRPAAVAFEVLPDRHAVEETLEEDATAALAAVETGGARDGIVACWLRLEETVAAGGVPARPSETSTELVTRVLHALDVDPRAVAVLADLYREARFSGHPMGEDSRERARCALRSVRDDAARLGATT